MRRRRVSQVLERLGRRGPAGLSVELLDDDHAIFAWDTREEPARLTQSETATLRLVVQRLSNAQIAQARGVAERTVANQVASLLRKLGAASRFDLIRRFGRDGST